MGKPGSCGHYSHPSFRKDPVTEERGNKVVGLLTG